MRFCVCLKIDKGHVKKGKNNHEAIKIVEKFLLFKVQSRQSVSNRYCSPLRGVEKAADHRKRRMGIFITEM